MCSFLGTVDVLICPTCKAEASQYGFERTFINRVPGGGASHDTHMGEYQYNQGGEPIDESVMGKR